jgi:hypothetical protein
MKNELVSFWHSLRDAEYLHLVLDDLLPFGLFIGVLAIAFGLGVGERRMRWFGLLLLCVTAMTVWPATSMRKKALPRMLALTEEVAFVKLTQAQAERRTSCNMLYYATAVLAVLGLGAGALKKGNLVIIAVILLGSISAIHALWLHKKDCEVYHRNIVKQRL